MPPEASDRSAVEARFAEVFRHLGLIRAYASRRGAHDPDELAAEVMAIAWRRLADVPSDDPRPWLIGTARNLVLADRRHHRMRRLQDLEGVEPPAPEEPLAPIPGPGCRAQERALASLSPHDREALLLVAWEDPDAGGRGCQPRDLGGRIPRPAASRASPARSRTGKPRAGTARGRQLPTQLEQL